MATMISSGTDVVAFLKEQHEQIKAGFQQVQSTTGEDRDTAFFALRRLLAVHETAEAMGGFLNVPAHVRRHPWLMVGGALLLGVVLGNLAGRWRR